MLDRFVQRSSIRRTLMAIMALALLPLLALTVWQGVARFDKERQVTKVRLDDRAEIVATSRLHPLRSTAGLLALLATDAQVFRAVHPACTTALQTASAAFSHVSAVVVTAPDGAVTCASSDAAAGIGRMLGPAAPLPLPGEARVRLSTANTMPPSDDDSLLMTLRLDDGTRIAARIDPAWLEGMAGTLDGKSQYAVTLTDGSGYILAGSRPLDRDRIDPRMIAARQGMADATGRRWLHGGARLFSGQTDAESVYLVLSQPEPEPFDPTWLFNISYVLLPVMALMLAWLAIWIGADRSILRWVSDIGAVADEIGRGERVPSDERFMHAPDEIRSLAAQLKRVARIIADRDQTLRRAAQQERLSALELNHRVRNNLQVIGSWLALERAQLPNEQGGDAMGRVAVRVAAISLVHRLLYDGSEQALPSPSALIGPLCQLLERHGIGRPMSCQAGSIDVPMAIDAAVQMALWLVEAGLAMLPDAALRPVAVQLSADEASIRLELLLQHDMGAGPASFPVPPVLRAIARQMGGTTDASGAGNDPDRPVAYRLIIPRPHFSNMQRISV